MGMASYVKYSLFFLLSCSATILAAFAQPELSHSNSKSSISPYSHGFPNDQLYHASLVIQRFKKTITCDPKSITSTWTGHDICGSERYLGFYCATPSGPTENLTVTSINFHGFGLCAPKLQGFIDQLADLAIFEATSNNFTDDIPRLAGLSYMYTLDVGNDHAGQKYEPLGRHCVQIQAEIIVKGGGSRCMDFLAVQKTEELSEHTWTNAKALLLNYNNLSGPLPATIGFSKLSYLALANNKLTGPIPQSIGQAKDSLLELLLLNNQLSGCLPHELGMLTKTTVIDAGKNQLTGPIPQSFSCLSSVEQLNLGENRLYGQVPDALCKLGRLANLTLAGNYFSSVGPACAALVKDGVLDVKRNCIPGLANHRAPAECASFMSQLPKASCPAASAPVSCPAAATDAKTKIAPEGRVAAKDYSSYVTYATLHE